MPPGSGAHPPTPHPPDPALLAIAQATQATADAVTRLLAVARFGPTAGAGAGAGGFGGYGGGSSGMSGPRPGTSAFAEGQKTLAERTDILSRLGMGGIGGSANRVGQFAGGLQAAGMTGPAALAQRAALPLAVAGHVANSAEKIAGYAYDRYSTAEQQGRQAVRDFVPGGARIQGFVDAMSGRAAGYEQADIDARYRSAASHSRTETAQFQLGYNPRQAGAEGLAGAYRGQTAVTNSVFDRSSALGERAYREEQRILPLKQAEAKAERDAAVASRERLATQGELTKLTGRGFELTRQRAALERKLGDSGSGVDRQDTLKRIETVNAELTANLGLQKQAQQDVVGATQREAQARGERQKAGVRTQLLGEAETLESRADTSADSARRLGGQNQYQRAYGLAAARLIKERGSTDGLPSSYVQAGMGYAPIEIGKIIENTGANSAEFKAGQEEFSADFAGNPNDMRKKAAELRKQAGEREFSIDAAVAEQSATAGRNLGQFLAQIMTQLTDAAKLEILNQVRLGRNAK